jgi:hypothetical protein
MKFSINLRLACLAIGFLELLWYCYTITVCFMGLDKDYYTWQMRIIKNFEIEQAALLFTGIVIASMSTWCTLGLLSVAIYRGQLFRSLILVYSLKNVFTVLAEIGLIVQQIIIFKHGHTDGQTFTLSMIFFILCGFVAPVIFGFIAMAYYYFNLKLESIAIKLFNLYEDKLKNRKKVHKKSKHIIKDQKAKSHAK